MSWRVITEDDLTASLSAAEIDAYRKSSQFGDPVEAQLRVNESRTLAYNKACELFDQVRKGEFVPESDGEDEDALAPAGSPIAAPACPPRLLD